ncbi:hypothetical protein ACT009_03170 [Sphingomonas sp. Tas61C01]|uniref:hypothetical protein n=1 Tax=Sphingomonas sp. Tas61C01 TaxID=3458297 RepID=UPI00403EE6A1
MLVRDATAVSRQETMMGENDASKPETVEQDGTGGPEESGAGYGNNAGYQGEAEADDDAEVAKDDAD